MELPYAQREASFHAAKVRTADTVGVTIISSSCVLIPIHYILFIYFFAIVVFVARKIYGYVGVVLVRDARVVPVYGVVPVRGVIPGTGVVSVYGVILGFYESRRSVNNRNA